MPDWLKSKGLRMCFLVCLIYLFIVGSFVALSGLSKKKFDGQVLCWNEKHLLFLALLFSFYWALYIQIHLLDCCCLSYCWMYAFSKSWWKQEEKFLTLWQCDMDSDVFRFVWWGVGSTGQGLFAVLRRDSQCIPEQFGNDSFSWSKLAFNFKPNWISLTEWMEKLLQVSWILLSFCCCRFLMGGRVTVIWHGQLMQVWILLS